MNQDDIQTPPIKIQLPLVVLTLATAIAMNVFKKFTDAQLSLDELLVKKQILEQKRFLALYKHFNAWTVPTIKAIQSLQKETHVRQIIFAARLFDIIKEDFSKFQIKSHINTALLYDKANIHDEIISSKEIGIAMDYADNFYALAKEYLLNDTSKLSNSQQWSLVLPRSIHL